MLTGLNFEWALFTLLNAWIWLFAPCDKCKWFHCKDKKKKIRCWTYAMISFFEFKTHRIKWMYLHFLCSVTYISLYYGRHETECTKKKWSNYTFHAIGARKIDCKWATRCYCANERFNYHQFRRSLCVKSSLNYFRFLWFTFQGLSRFVAESFLCPFECESVCLCVSFSRFITILLFVRQQSGKKVNSIFLFLLLFSLSSFSFQVVFFRALELLSRQPCYRLICLQWICHLFILFSFCCAFSYV